MHRFTDNANRDWSVQINVATVKRVRAALGLDLMKAVGGNVLEQLASDPILLVDALYVVCEPQAQERGVSDIQFGEAMAGEAIEKAADAFLGELLDFFQPRQREMLAKIYRKVKEVEERTSAATHAALDNPALGVAIERQIQEAEKAMLLRLNQLGASSGNAPESLG